MDEKRTYIPPENLPVEEPIGDIVSPVAEVPLVSEPAPTEPLIVIPSTIPPTQPVTPTFTLEEIQQQAQAMSESGQPNTMIPPPIVEAPITVRTYEHDMARAMNVSDAKTVQVLLNNARDRENLDIVEHYNKKARRWYTAGSIFLLLIALGAIGYGAYHYQRLTVPITGSTSVGVFASTEPIVASTTTIESVLEQFMIDDQTLSINKPYLIELVGDAPTQTLLSNAALFSFLGATPTEPFSTSLGVVRLGVVDTGEKTTPFIIASTTNPDVAIKEFLIAEPTLLAQFTRALALDTTTIPPETVTSFTGEYRYNVPVRTLYTTDISGNKVLTVLYASITENIIVLTTDPAVLKAVYDTVLRQ